MEVRLARNYLSDVEVRKFGTKKTINIERGTELLCKWEGDGYRLYPLSGPGKGWYFDIEMNELHNITTRS